MPEKITEDDKKHGDPLESLIGRTMKPSSRKSERTAEDGVSTHLEDDDDDDVQNANPENRRDSGERE